MDSSNGRSLSSASSSKPKLKVDEFELDGKIYRKSQYYNIRRKKRLKEDAEAMAEYKKRLIECFGTSQSVEGVLSLFPSSHVSESGDDRLPGGNISTPSTSAPVDHAECIANDENQPTVHILPSSSFMSDPPLIASFPDMCMNAEYVDNNDDQVVIEHGDDLECESGNVQSDDEGVDDKCEGNVSLLRQKKTELHAIFSLHGITLAGQSSIMQFFREFPAELLPKLPKDARSLRPAQIEHTRIVVPPGQLVYFGVECMFNYAMPGVLFDADANEINLAVNMDGLPLTRSPNGIGFWPILGSVGDYPVFIIGAYEGRKKPECANNYIYHFVEEMKRLSVHGIRVRNRVYKFRLEFLNMDGPATSMITGVKHPGGLFACRRCRVRGESGATHTYVNKKNQQVTKKLSVRYPTLHTATRTHHDFVLFAKTMEDPHPQITDATIDDVENEGTSSLEECDVDEEEDDFFEEEADEDIDSVDETMREITPTWLAAMRRKQLTVKEAKLSYHLHRTILTEIPHFNVALDCVLDFMHVVPGHVRALLEYFTGTGTIGAVYKLDVQYLTVINERLLESRKYCPREFQRRADSLEHLTSWKATQLRQFLLYLGPVVLRDAVDDAKLSHFHLLVVAMRLMCRKLPLSREESKKKAKAIASECRRLLQRYFVLGNELYGINFSRYLAHLIPHIPDDYERFQRPLDSISAFRYENYLGHVKRLVKGHFQPLTQVVNRISSLLHTKLYTKNQMSRIVSSLEAYFEVPELHGPVDDEDNKYGGEQEHLSHKFERGQVGASNCGWLKSFRELRYKDFILRTDNHADKYCFLRGERQDYFVQLTKILKDEDTEEIFLVGNVFDRCQSLFTLAPTSPSLTSMEAGITLVDRLSTQTSTFTLSCLSEKCFALPLNLRTDTQESTYEKWVLIRYLH